MAENMVRVFDKALLYQFFTGPYLKGFMKKHGKHDAIEAAHMREVADDHVVGTGEYVMPYWTRLVPESEVRR